MARNAQTYVQTNYDWDRIANLETVHSTLHFVGQIRCAGSTFKQTR